MLFKKKDICYQSCNEIPLYNFIKVLAKKDFSYLVVSGSPKHLDKVWEKILNEYIELTGSEKQTQMLSLMKEVAFLGNKIFLIKSVEYSLRIQYSEELVLQLKKLGFNINLNVKNYDQYNKQLDILLTRLKSTINIYETKSNELKELQKVDESDKDLESQYLGWLTDLSKFQGYRLDPKEITVIEFISIMESYKNSIPKNNGK